MKLLDKYLFREMVFPFLYGFLIILLLVFGNIVYSYLDLIVSRINEWYLVLSFLICKLPSCVLISFAAGGIFAASIGINRMVKDSELVIIKNSGVSDFRIFGSIMVFAVLLTMVAYLFQEVIVVKAEEQSESILNTLYSIPGDLPIEPNIFIKTADYAVYVNSIMRTSSGVVYNKVQLYRLNRDFPTIINARLAKENNGYWTLEDGYSCNFNPDGSPNIVAKFKTLKIDISDSVFAQITSPIKDAKVLSARELYNQIKIRKASGMNIDDLILEYNFKLAFPLSTFVILLCLVPLCLMMPMKGSSVGMVLGIIVFFIYWNIMWFSRILGQSGGLPANLAGWSIVIIFGFFGLILSLRMLKH